MADLITPPPELVQQWMDEPEYVSGWNGKCMMLSITDYRFNNICAKAAQWGADQELDKSNNWLVLNGYGEAASRLRAARRPQPPSMKEQALRELSDAYDSGKIDDTTYNTIRRALEALDD